MSPQENSSLDQGFRIDFIIIGAQKSGTTSLAAQLAAHPEICFCQDKEPGYFNSVIDWKEKLQDYHRLYSRLPGQRCGEASTMYTFLPEFTDTHSRLFEYNPKLKLIYIMRHPVERIVSHYAHRVNHGRLTESPEKIVLKDPTFINRSRYAYQIKPYVELFGRENILLMPFEEYISDQLESLKSVSSFLGISYAPFQNLDFNPKNESIGKEYLGKTGRKIRDNAVARLAGPLIPEFVREAVKSHFSKVMTQKPKFPPLLRKTLWDILEEEVNSVEKLLNRRIDAWRKKTLNHNESVV
jgi:Sulfotransferase domain